MDIPEDKTSTSNTSPTPKPAEKKPLNALDMSAEEYAAARKALCVSIGAQN